MGHFPTKVKKSSVRDKKTVTQRGKALHSECVKSSSRNFAFASEKVLVQKLNCPIILYHKVSSDNKETKRRTKERKLKIQGV